MIFKIKDFQDIHYYKFNTNNCLTFFQAFFYS